MTPLFVLVVMERKGGVGWLFVFALLPSLAVGYSAYYDVRMEYRDEEGGSGGGGTISMSTCGTIDPEWFRCRPESSLSPSWCRYQNPVRGTVFSHHV